MRTEPFYSDLPIVRVRLVREFAPSAAHRIASPEDAAAVLLHVIGPSDREQFVVLLLSTTSELLGVHVVSMGCLSHCLVTPRGVFKAALLANANTVILGHNHPSGDPTPSTDDVETTGTLVNAGKLLGVEVLDHVIVSPNGAWRSLMRLGHLSKGSHLRAELCADSDTSCEGCDRQGDLAGTHP